MSTELRSAMPERFPFYHLGLVERTEAPLDLGTTDRLAFAFGIYGEFQGTLVLLVERGIDTSVYSEIGNTMASLFATRLSARGELTQISAPKMLDSLSLGRVFNLSRIILTERYLHMAQGRVIPMEVMLLGDLKEGNVGNA